MPDFQKMIFQPLMFTSQDYFYQTHLELASGRSREEVSHNVSTQRIRLSKAATFETATASLSSADLYTLPILSACLPPT